MVSSTVALDMSRGLEQYNVLTIWGYRTNGTFSSLQDTYCERNVLDCFFPPSIVLWDRHKTKTHSVSNRALLSTGVNVPISLEILPVKLLKV